MTFEFLLNVAPIFFLLLIGHAVADFPLQHEGMIRGKNPQVSQPGPGYDPELHGPPLTTWPYYLTAHALVHAGMVMLVTFSPLWAAYEFGAHWIIDYVKSTGRTTIHQDQFLHIVTKLFIAVAVVITGAAGA